MKQAHFLPYTVDDNCEMLYWNIIWRSACTIRSANTISYNAMVLEVSCNQCAAWCWQNQTSMEVTIKNMQSKGSHLNRGSLAENAGHLIMVSNS